MKTEPTEKAIKFRQDLLDYICNEIEKNDLDKQELLWGITITAAIFFDSAKIPKERAIIGLSCAMDAAKDVRNKTEFE